MTVSEPSVSEPSVSEPSVSEPSVSEPSVSEPQPAAAPDAQSATPLQAAVARLAGIHERPTHEQADLYQSVHTELQNALGTIDDA